MPTRDISLAYAVPLIAYVLGSIPSALLVSRRAGQVDIREHGDGNMGARNVSRTLGWHWGTLVAALDVGKGMLATLLAEGTGLSLGWRIVTGFCVLLGHDFPIFAGFRGGQGLATTLGVLTVLAPLETLAGVAVYGLLFLITRHSDLSAGIGIGLLVLLLVVRGQPFMLVASAIGMILTVPAKMMLDRPRRVRARPA
jgi:glycerol-3-phosphate acyltransferase PlsY